MTDHARIHRRTRQPPPDDRDQDQDDELADAITRAQAGDEDAFTHVYRTAHPRLLNYLRGTVGETDAEDVAAETWISITRSLHTFHGTAGGFYAWSATIARHRAIDHLRKPRPVAQIPLDQLPDEPTRLDTADQVEQALDTAHALALIRQLPTDQAQAILLRVVIGLDTDTTARILGKHAGAIRTNTHRGLRTLARRLQPGSDPPPTTPVRRPNPEPCVELTRRILPPHQSAPPIAKEPA